MKKQIHKAVFLFAMLLVFISCQAKSQASTGEQSSSLDHAKDLAITIEKAGLRMLKERIPARDFSLPLASDGVNHSLSSLKGKIVFLNFWATWCGPCRAEMPSMEALYSKYKDEGLEILAVNSMENKADVIAFMNNNKLSFPAALDLDGKVNRSYGIQAIPTTFLIDRKGNIVVRLVGSINWDSPQIHAVIEEMLKE